MTGEGVAIHKPARRRTRAGRPTREQAGAAEERILEAATRLFASRGFAGTSMERVAATCGAGKDTVYRRFPTKLKLFEDVVSQARKEAQRKLEGLVLSEGDALTRLKALMKAMLVVNMDPELIALKRITFSETLVSGAVSAIPSQPDPIMDRLVATVTEAQEEGVLRAVDSCELATHLIHSLVAIPTTDALLGGSAFATPEALDLHFETIWAWLLNGVAA